MTSAADAVGPTPWRGDAADGVRAWLRQAGHEVPETAPRTRPAPRAEEDELGPDADIESVARRILLDQLSRRAMSRAELLKKMRAKNVPDEISEGLLDRFAEVKLVDDEAFARAWVEQRAGGKQLGRRALVQELRNKGVSGLDIESALSAVTADDELAAARAYAAKRARSLRGVDAVAARRRLSGGLARKGHSSAVIAQVVGEALGELEPQD